MGDSKSSGIASIIIVGGIVIGCVIVGIISEKYLGNGNPVELEAEKIIKDETGIEVNLDIPEKKK